MALPYLSALVINNKFIEMAQNNLKSSSFASQRFGLGNTIDVCVLVADRYRRARSERMGRWR
jgi:hypothetical protein